MTRRVRAGVIIGTVFLLDRVTKIYIRNHFSPFDTLPVIPGFFNIVHAENPGAAFSMLAEAPEAIRRTVLIAASSAVMIAVGVMLFRKPAKGETALTPLALALVFGGALGNLWDRVLVGTVTDFLQFFFGAYEYPSFNVADSAVFIGACLLILDLFRGRKAT